MSQKIILIVEKDVEIIIPNEYIKYSKVINSLIEGNTDPEIKLPLFTINEKNIRKFIEFCAVIEKIPDITSSNLMNQFSSLDPECKRLLNSLIESSSNPAVGGGGEESSESGGSGDFLADMINTCNFLDCNKLLKLLCGFFCLTFLTGKSPSQVRAEWGIINDFTPDEEAVIAKEEKWLNQ